MTISKWKQKCQDYDFLKIIVSENIKARGPIHEANIQQFLSYVSCKTKLQ